MKSTNYILVKCTERWSHKSQQHYYLLTFLDPDTLTIYECSVDPDMDNWKHWLEHLTKPNPLGIYSNLKTSKRVTRDNTPIISADSIPHLQDTLTVDEVTLLVTLLLED